MNKNDLQNLDIEALLESAEYLADELRLSHAEVPASTVLELCRRLRAAKEVFVLSCDEDRSEKAVARCCKTVHEDFGVEL